MPARVLSRDRHLRLEMFSLTPGVLRMTASTAALVSFVESSSLLRELAGVEVSASQVERAAEALGAEIAADERTCLEPAGEVAPTMYLGMDGTGVPMRASELAGRAGKLLLLTYFYGIYYRKNGLMSRRL
jgi:hypothetical protein